MQTSFPVDDHRLDNGLRVIVSEDHGAPVVAVNLWYNVGSRHERAGRTGLAHLFEHLMFEGSRQVAPGEHFRLLTVAGGALNGTTSTERTNYFECLPAAQLDLALWLEADRMGGLLDALTQESLDKQRDVVRNERRQRFDNVPYGRAFEVLCSLLYPEGHPYHHQPIGSMEDLAAASLEDVRDFFRAYYAPNNAVLTIVGDVDPGEALARADHYFGAIPRFDEIQSAPSGAIAPLDAEVRVTLQERVPNTALYIGYRLPAEGDPQLDHADLAFTILTGGRGSALYRELIQTERAKQAGGSVDRRVAGSSVGMLVIIGRPDCPIEKAEAAMRAEIERLATEGPTEAELRRAKAVVERQWLDRVADIEGRADELSRAATLFDDPHRVNNWLEPRLAATAEDVRAAVADYLVGRHAAVVHYEPTPETKAAA